MRSLLHKFSGLLLIFTVLAITACGGKTTKNDNPKTQTPFFTPTTASITKTASITISCADTADIYYTTDGTDPSKSSLAYTAGFTLTPGNYTLKAIAYASGKDASDVGIKTYAVNDGPVIPVVSASPVAGQYSSAQTVSLSTSNSPTDTIYYTTNGDTPVIGGASTSVYNSSSKISVSASLTIRAFAVTTGAVQGNTAIFVYTIDDIAVPSPVITPALDEITVSSLVSITASLGIIKYTIDDTDVANGSSYSAPFTLTEGTHIVRAIAVNNSKTSVTAMKNYLVKKNSTDPVKTPEVLLPTGVLFHTTTQFSISCATAGATIQYSLDGGAYVTYTAALTLPVGYHKLIAKAVKTGLTDSSEIVVPIDIVPDTAGARIYCKAAAAPKIWIWETNASYNTSTVMGFTWDGRPSMSALTGASGWFYFDIPTANVKGGTINTKFDTGSDLTIPTGKFWYKDGTWFSANPDVPAIPVINASPVPKTYRLAQSVTLTGSNTDDVIYYTTDGTDPTVSSTKYTGPVNVNKTMTVKAIGKNSDGLKGSIATFAYIIDASYDDVLPVIRASADPKWYQAPVTVTFYVSDNSPIATRVYYTTDNSTPTESSTLYLQGDCSTEKSGTSFSVAMNEIKLYKFLVIDGAGNRVEASFRYKVALDNKDDFRKETIYFVMTTRFYDGDPTNNFNCWDEASYLNNPATDPGWRGDFKGLVDKLDYIKALGFTAIWVTPPVKNASGLDYHGYHAINFKQIDPRYKTSSDSSAMEAYQKFIDACHAKGMKVVQDIVLNHSSNFGEENFFPLYEKDASGYTGLSNAANMTPNAAMLAAAGRLAAQQGKTVEYILANQPYQTRLECLKTVAGDPNWLYHHGNTTEYNQWVQQDGDLAGDCRDLNTENSLTADYLKSAYDQYINMGVDAFRIDTVKHISRLTFNNFFLPHFKQTGGENFYMFGECANIYSSVWDNGIPAQSTPHYTWKESKSYSWSLTDYTVNVQSTKTEWTDNLGADSQPTSTNHSLNGNTYHTPDYSKNSGLGMIDFCMHHNFGNAGAAFGIGSAYDNTYNDATWNVVYVDSHDYGPNNDGGLNMRFNGSESTLAENMTLMFTFRGIPTLYYGTEIQFQKGKDIEPGRNRIPLANSGRAYYGANLEGTVTASNFGDYTSASGVVKSTLDHPLAKHIARLNKIRRAIPALQMGQYSTADISKSGTAAFKRGYVNASEGVDSFVLVTISGDATFSNIPNGTYVDAVTGGSVNVTNGTLTASCSGQGNAKIYVLSKTGNPAPGIIGTAGTYLK